MVRPRLPGRPPRRVRAFQAILVVGVASLAGLGGELALRIVDARRFQADLQRFPEIERRWQRTREVLPLLTRSALTGPPGGMLGPAGKGPDGPRFERFDAIPATAFRQVPVYDAEAEVRIACFGGSTTWGPSGTLPGYPAFAQRSWDDALGAGVVRVFNMGLPISNSATTGVLFERFAPVLRPDIVVLYQGFNDILYHRARALAAGLGDAPLRLAEPTRGLRGRLRPVGPRPAVDVWAAAMPSYERFVAQAIALGATPYVSSFAHPDFAALTDEERALVQAELRFLWPVIGDLDTYATSLAAYNDGMRAWAARSGVGYIDVERAHPGELSAFTDICHRRDPGLAAHAAAVVAALAPAVEARRRATTGR